MRKNARRTRLGQGPGNWLPNVAIAIAWLAVFLFLFASYGVLGGLPVAVLTLAALGVTLAVHRLVEKGRWSRPLHQLSVQLASLAEKPNEPLDLNDAPALEELMRSIDELRIAWLEATRLGASAAYYREMIAGGGATATPVAGPSKLKNTMTRSGMLAAMPQLGVEGDDSGRTAELVTTDMVNRLEPGSLRWIDSSPAEQRFLGWDLATLRTRSFLDLLHPDDQARVRRTGRAGPRKRRGAWPVASNCGLHKAYPRPSRSASARGTVPTWRCRICAAI